MRAPVRAEGSVGCFLEGVDACSGRVMDSICEGHSWKLFQIAWR